MHASLEALLPRLTAAQPFEYVLRHGDASAVIYAPKGEDRQYAHDKAEVYVVARGEGRFRNGTRTIAFRAGDLLFVDVAVEHRFTAFSPDFAVWAVFFGPSILGDHAFTARAGSAEHTGRLSISQASDGDSVGDVFLAKWQGPGGERHGLGFGRDGHVGFARARQEKLGLVEYRIEHGLLQARWAHRDFGAWIGTGEGTPQAPTRGFAGRYSIQYRDAAGKPMLSPFALDIASEGVLRRLSWVSEVARFEGIGIEVGDMLLAAWAAPVPGLELELVDYKSALPGASVLAGRTVRSSDLAVGVEDVSLATSSQGS